MLMDNGEQDWRLYITFAGVEKTGPIDSLSEVSFSGQTSNSHVTIKSELMSFDEASKICMLLSQGEMQADLGVSNEFTRVVMYEYSPSRGANEENNLYLILGAQDKVQGNSFEDVKTCGHSVRGVQEAVSEVIATAQKLSRE